MSGLIYVPSTDIDDGGKTRIGGHFFRKEFLPDVSLNSLGKWETEYVLAEKDAWNKEFIVDMWPK